MKPCKSTAASLLKHMSKPKTLAQLVLLVKRQTRWSLDKHGCLTTQPDGQWISREDLLKALKGKL